MLLHLFIDGPKRRKIRWATDVTVVSKWTDWLLLHPFVLLPSLVSPVATIIGLRYLKVDLDLETQAVVYILAGYSADSVADAFIGQVNGMATRTTKTITAKL